MELNETIQNRSSVRRFSEEPVKPDDLYKMITMAGKAPSVNNSQPWKFIAITNPILIKKMALEVHKKIQEYYPDGSEKAIAIKSTVDYFSTIFEKAPAVIAVAARSYDSISESLFEDREQAHIKIDEMRFHPDIQSIGAAVQNILLSAVDLGYGTCWLSGLLIARQELQKILQIEEPWRLATFVAVGHPAGTTAQSRKKNIEEIFSLIQ
jgi:nitroreductase